MTKKGVSKELISVAETAQILGYSRQHILRLIESGEIKAQKIGRSFVVERDSLPEVFGAISKEEKKEVDRAVSKVVSEYSEALKKLGKE